MTAHLPRSVLLAWAALVVVTAGSWWLGTGHGLGDRAAGAVVLALGFGKAALVAWSFMDLRTAPPGLCGAVLGLLAACGVAVVAFFLLA